MAAADFIVPLVVVGLAELGDKTQLSILLLSSKTKSHFRLLAGVMLGFLVVDGVAVLLGSWITGVVPASVLKALAGVVFIIFGLLIFKDGGSKAEGSIHPKNAFLAGFTLILMTEWGDKTQIASGLFATEYSAPMVLAGAMAALTVLSAIAIYVGKLVSGRIDRRLMTRIAGILFILLGLYSLLM